MRADDRSNIWSMKMHRIDTLGICVKTECLIHTLSGDGLRLIQVIVAFRLLG